MSAQSKREAAEHEATDNQPGSEILPLHLVARGIGDVAEQGAQEQWNGSGEQHRVERVKRSFKCSVQGGRHCVSLLIPERPRYAPMNGAARSDARTDPNHKALLPAHQNLHGCADEKVDGSLMFRRGRGTHSRATERRTTVVRRPVLARRGCAA